jgi:DUF4097 and DUF4098 domain-containing protein YvlB
VPNFTLDISRNFDVSTPLHLTGRFADSRVLIHGAEGSSARVEVKLEIRADDRNTAEAEAERYAQGIAFDSGSLTVESPETAGGFWRHHRVRAEYDIAVPHETRAEVRLANGALQVRDIAGPLDAQLANGPILIEGIGAAVRARVGNGPIGVKDCGADLDISVVNGPLRVGRVGGALSFDVTNGPVSVEDVALALRGKVLNGPLTYGGAIGGDFDLETNHGSITLHLPSGSRFELDAESDHGRVHSDFRVAEEQVRSEPAHKLRLRTGSGNIHLAEVPRPAPAAV